MVLGLGTCLHREGTSLSSARELFKASGVPAAGWQPCCVGGWVRIGFSGASPHGLDPRTLRDEVRTLESQEISSPRLQNVRRTVCLKQSCFVSCAGGCRRVLSAGDPYTLKSPEPSAMGVWLSVLTGALGWQACRAWMRQ